MLGLLPYQVTSATTLPLLCDPQPRSKTSSKSHLNSSRRLLGASFAHVSHKWEPRSTAPPHGHGASTSDDGSDSDLEAPLLQNSLNTHRGRYRAAVAVAQGARDSLLHRTVSAGSSGSSGTARPPAAADTAGGSSSDVRDGAGGRLGGSSTAVGTERLVKYGSSEFAKEAPFFSAPPQAAQPSGQVSYGPLPDAELQSSLLTRLIPPQHCAAMTAGNWCARLSLSCGAGGGQGASHDCQISAADAHHSRGCQFRGE